MSQVEVEKFSRTIYTQLFQSPAYIQCDWVFTYINMKNEVETKPIIEQCWKEGKRVAVPKIYKDRRMTFVEITAWDQLTEGKFGTVEPVQEGKKEVKPSLHTMIIVPGLVFDENKHRIGYGGGYYDFYLSQIASIGYTIGICYDFQLIKDIPTEIHDLPLHCIITEKRWIK